MGMARGGIGDRARRGIIAGRPRISAPGRRLTALTARGPISPLSHVILILNRHFLFATQSERTHISTRGGEHVAAHGMRKHPAKLT
jgi:hypothetical protein